MSHYEQVMPLHAEWRPAVMDATLEQSEYIAARTLGLQFGERQVLRNISLRVTAGRITALVGPSGVGKSSLLACINRLTDMLPGARVSGELHVGGVDALGSSTDVIALRRRVGMIFQKPNPFPLSIWNNLAFPLREHGMRDKQQVAETIITTLQEIGLWAEVKDRLHATALLLSGGQQQRLCMARALALQPEALLLDEPCSALDPIAVGVVEELIARLRGRYTMLIVTHNLAQARRLADDVALLWPCDGAGELVEQSPAARIFDSPREAVTAAYIRGERI